MSDQPMGYTANIAKELEIFIRPIDSVKPHKDNPREHRIEKIAQSLAAHGQRKPIIIDLATDTIIAGHGVWEAATLLGWDHIAMLPQSFEDGEHALEYLFADNRASDLSTYKRDKLLQGLEKLAGGPGLLDTLFEVQELEDLREEFTPLAVMPDLGAHEDDEERPTGEAKIAEAKTLPGGKLHEMPILLTDDDYKQVTNYIRTLQQEWRLNGVTETIIAAIKYSVEHIGEHKEPEDDQAAVDETPSNVSPLRSAP